MNLELQQVRDAAWLKGYKQGAADEHAEGILREQRAVAAERQRVRILLSQFPDHTPISEIIQAIK